jgi:hypothetical protein
MAIRRGGEVALYRHLSECAGREVRFIPNEEKREPLVSHHELDAKKGRPDLRAAGQQLPTELEQLVRRL